MAKEVVEPGSAELGPDAYKKLYPAEFYKRFIDNNLRPDGRPFGGGRPVTIGVGAIESADASALVKIGSTSVLAGLTFAVSCLVVMLIHLNFDVTVPWHYNKDCDETLMHVCTGGSHIYGKHFQTLGL